MNTIEMTNRKLALDELYQRAVKDRDPLVGRFTGHALDRVVTLGGVATDSTMDQLVTAALIEAYRMGREDSRREHEMRANQSVQLRCERAQRELRKSLDEALKCLTRQDDKW